MPRTPELKTLLHVGCGHRSLPASFSRSEWREIRCDSDPATLPEVQASATDLHPLADASVDAVYAHHQLQLLPAHQVPQALAEWLRVLRPGGVAWVVVPDMQALGDRMSAGDLEGTLYRSPSGPITAMDLLWGHRAALASGQQALAHRSGFSATTLKQQLQHAGFAPVQVDRHAPVFEIVAAASRPVAAQGVSPGPASASASASAAASAPAAEAPTANTLFDQGRVAQAAGRWSDAQALYLQALQLQPTLWPARFEMGVAYFGAGQLPEAIEHVRQALQLEPRFARAHSALGTFLGMTGRHADALPSLQRAVELEPKNAENHYNLGKAHSELNALSAAEDAYRQALRITPQHALAQLNLGKVLNEQGLTQEGLALYRQATQHLTDPALMSSLPMLLNFVDGVSDAEVFAAHRDYDRRFAQALTARAETSAPYRLVRPASPSPRRLRVAYLSRDLRQHSVRYFLLPILEHHDRSRFEITAYNDNALQDAVTAHYRSLCDHWVDCDTLSDEALAQRIRDDGIDVLVDLAGHTNRNRLLALARKPAPVQVTYLGYPATTGVSALTHRVSDRFIDPPPPHSAQQPLIETSEAPLRLQHGYFCYAPMVESPDVSALPFDNNGFITFGSLNQGSKLTPTLLRAWAQLLGQMPSARLCLQNMALHETRACQRLADAFAALGVDAKRLQFKPFAPAPQYLQTYHGIDIALDSYPYNGGTTTCEALWMGVPVVSWCGTRHVGRLGASILNQVHLSELVAHSADAYVHTAATLASDPQRLRALRSTMRTRLQASPLMDHAGFTRELEAGYLQAHQQALQAGA